MRLLAILIVFFCTFKSYNAFSNDFIEFFNRRAYSFNNGFDSVVFNDSYFFYKDNIKISIKKNVENFFYNSYEISNFFCNFFIFDLDKMKLNLSKFLFNSFFGFFGILDVTGEIKSSYKKINIISFFKKKNFFSTYFFLPIVGPICFFNFFCLFFNKLFNLQFYFFDNLYFYSFLEILSKKDEFSIDIKFFNDNFIDGYSFFKNAYLQNIFYS